MSLQVTVRKIQSHEFSAAAHVAQAFAPGQVTDMSRGFTEGLITEQVLVKLDQSLAVLVALHNEVVIGFLGLSRYQSGALSPVINDMKKHIAADLAQDHDLMQDAEIFLFGPVVIAKQAQGQGVFHKLYASMWQYLPLGYKRGYAFIAENNSHSFYAHVKGLAARTVCQFMVSDKMYWLIALDRSDECVG